MMTVCPSFADSSLPTRGETGSTFSRNGLDVRSFITQGDDRVHAHGAARGDVAGDQGNARQQNGDARERYWIGRADSIDQFGNEPRQAKRGSYADSDPDQRNSHTSSQHHAQDVLTGCPERHTYSNLVSTLACQIGNHTVNADSGKNESKRREQAEEKHCQPLGRDRARNDFFHGPNVVEDRTAHHFFGALANGTGEVSRTACGAGNVLAAICQ